MEYEIVSAEGERELMAQVNNKLNEGWVLQGGISCLITDENEWYFFQAMVLQR